MVIHWNHFSRMALYTVEIQKANLPIITSSSAGYISYLLKPCPPLFRNIAPTPPSMHLHCLPDGHTSQTVFQDGTIQYRNAGRSAQLTHPHITLGRVHILSAQIVYITPPEHSTHFSGPWHPLIRTIAPTPSGWYICCISWPYIVVLANNAHSSGSIVYVH